MTWMYNLFLNSKAVWESIILYVLKILIGFFFLGHAVYKNTDSLFIYNYTSIVCGVLQLMKIILVNTKYKCFFYTQSKSIFLSKLFNSYCPSNYVKIKVVALFIFLFNFILCCVNWFKASSPYCFSNLLLLSSRAITIAIAMVGKAITIDKAIK